MYLPVCPSLWWSGCLGGTPGPPGLAAFWPPDQLLCFHTQTPLAGAGRCVPQHLLGLHCDVWQGLGECGPLRQACRPHLLLRAVFMHVECQNMPCFDAGVYLNRMLRSFDVNSADPLPMHSMTVSTVK